MEVYGVRGGLVRSVFAITAAAVALGLTAGCEGVNSAKTAVSCSVDPTLREGTRRCDAAEAEFAKNYQAARETTFFVAQNVMDGLGQSEVEFNGSIQSDGFGFSEASRGDDMGRQWSVSLLLGHMTEEKGKPKDPFWRLVFSVETNKTKDSREKVYAEFVGHNSSPNDLVQFINPQNGGLDLARVQAWLNGNCTTNETVFMTERLNGQLGDPAFEGVRVAASLGAPNLVPTPYVVARRSSCKDTPTPENRCDMYEPLPVANSLKRIRETATGTFLFDPMVGLPSRGCL